MAKNATAPISFDREQLRRIVDEKGVHATAQALGTSREVVARAIGNLPLRRGSIALLSLALRGLGQE